MRALCSWQETALNVGTPLTSRARNSAAANYDYEYHWSLNASISDAPPVKSSATIISHQLTPTEKFSTGYPGWINISYDNSTSTETLNWITVDDLENHIKVAALSILRLSPPALSTDLNQDGIVNIIDITLVATAYGSTPGTPKWNEAVDLDSNETINIVDVTMVAKDYGKTT